MNSINLQDIKIGEDASVSDLRNAVIFLLNVVEGLWKEKEDLFLSNQLLKDEINRLKGEQGLLSLKQRRASIQIRMIIRVKEKKKAAESRKRIQKKIVEIR